MALSFSDIKNAAALIGVDLCADMTVNQASWWRKDFARAYAAYARQGVKLYGYLPGKVEISNTAGGYLSYVPNPITVGDTQKALAVLAAGEEVAVGAGVMELCRLPYDKREWMTERSQ